MKRKSLALILVFVLLTSALSSCLPFIPSPENSPSDPPSNGVFHRLGMTITLTPEFVDDSPATQFRYVSDTCTVSGYRHNFSEIEVLDGGSFPTIADFANLYNPTPNAHQSLKGTEAIYFEYSQSLGSTSVLCVVYEVEDAFYLFQFVCETYLYESMRDTFFDWAKSVTFDA
jgi:hypothetical protein